MSTVGEMLNQQAAIYEQRNALYGSSYKKFGAAMKSLLGEIKLESVDDYNRIGVLNMIVSKLTRYTANFNCGGHDDSLADLAVYATMLRELDEEIRTRIKSN